MSDGYYRYPTLAGETIVFCCEDDLWRVPATGGVPRRLTAGLGAAVFPALSPDGSLLAFSGREEGDVELYVMSAEGGPVRRLTFLGGTVSVAGWSPDGREILFASNARHFTQRETRLFAIAPEGGEPRELPWGAARHVAFGPQGQVVLGRNTGDPARWKRYKGGTAGALWVDPVGSGQFERLRADIGNPTTPMFVGDRLYFLADHEGTGNLYSCRPDGSELRRHTDHEDYYARQASSDGRRVVYHAGADLYLYDPASERTTRVPIEWHAPAAQSARKFVDAARFTDHLALHPRGHAVALTSRGKAFSMPNWAGAVTQHGERQGVRYRLASYLYGGDRLIAADESGEEQLVAFAATEAGPAEPVGPADLGRVVTLLPSPTADVVAVANHRHELYRVDVASGSATRLDKSVNGPIAGLAWSPDGAYLAYGFPNTPKTSCIKLAAVATGETREVTQPVLHDVAPAFDPKGRYLYFLSYRVLNPVYDGLHFDLGFPKGMRPCLLTLRADLPSPFVPPDVPETPEEPKAKPAEGAAADTPAKPAAEAPEPVVIDFAGIERRVVPFPVAEGRYSQVLGLPGKVLLVSEQPAGALEADWPPGKPSAKGKLEAYDFASQKLETLIEGISDVALAEDGKTMLVRVGDKWRVLPAGEKPKPDAPADPGRESGWLDLGRVRVSIDPRAEWRQMYAEAWRLQRDQFWTEDMSAIDWQQVHARYVPLLDRIATRAEFSDLMWEMQGELGTSHAYELGGDQRTPPRYAQGLLGASYQWDAAARGYRLTAIVHGDPGEDGHDSPLNRVGAQVKVGDVILAIGGQPLSETFSPDQALVHQADLEVQLTLAGEAGASPRNVTVRTLHSEYPARYRAWVDGNRRRVHEASNGRIGYLHIPDMGALGFAEFHRGWLVESQRDGLVVDVRYNGGGHVSQLLLEKLARRRLGYDVERWGSIKPFPDESIAGPLVALTNEHAGSDGDIFSHCFKLMKLGPLLGKRTWGGVIGIWPRHGLVDGTVTTQPEFSFWFQDVGWGVENYGTDPDIEVEYPPQAYAAGTDPQLDRAIAEAIARLEANPPQTPSFDRRPNLAAPKLPTRA